MFGVFTYGCPWQPRSPQPQSSAKMKTMLGFGASAADAMRRDAETQRMARRSFFMVGRGMRLSGSYRTKSNGLQLSWDDPYDDQFSQTIDMTRRGASVGYLPFWRGFLSLAVITPSLFVSLGANWLRKILRCSSGESLPSWFLSPPLKAPGWGNSLSSR